LLLRRIEFLRYTARMIDRRFYRPFVVLFILATIGRSILPSAPPQNENPY
jgi:hypothetical protein